MSAAGDAERYDGVAIAMHWTIALLIFANLPIGYFAEWIEEHVGRNLVPIHKSIGLTVLALTVLRLGWWIGHSPPPLPSDLAPWRSRASRWVHCSFYALLIAVPLTGWLRTSPNVYPLTWFGLGPLPKFPIEKGSAIAELARGSHELFAWAMFVLLIIHVAAALHHHFRMRDAVLLRMLPSRFMPKS